MEFISKKFLRALAIQNISDKEFVIVPNLNTSYNIKIGLTSVVKDIGFFETSDVSHNYYYGYGGVSIGLGEELLSDIDII